MKFIFPQNYKFKTKLLGIIDYQTAILNLIYDAIIFVILNIVTKNINVKIFIFIITSFPMLLFSIIGINGESIINVIIYMSKFIIKPKLLFYSK